MDQSLKNNLIEQSPSIIEEYWFEFERYFTEKYGAEWLREHYDILSRMCLAAAINANTAIMSIFGPSESVTDEGDRDQNAGS